LGFFYPQNLAIVEGGNKVVVDKVGLQAVIECVHVNHPDWRGNVYRGQLHFKRNGLGVEIEIDDRWVPGNNQLLMIMTAKVKRGLNRRSHTWFWDENTNPQFITNEVAGFPDVEFDAIVRLIDEVSLRLRTMTVEG
jgi:hypothetical protein